MPNKNYIYFEIIKCNTADHRARSGILASAATFFAKMYPDASIPDFSKLAKQFKSKIRHSKSPKWGVLRFHLELT